MIIIGIDTALRNTGYGVIEVKGKQFSVIDCGVITNKQKMPLSECLRRLSGGIEQIIESFQPEIASIEGGFYFRNVKTAMVLGMARGAVVAALARGNIVTYEYAPRRAKQAVVGNGSATKDQVALTIAQMTGIKIDEIPDHSTDAIAVALCHVLTQQSGNGIYLADPL